MGNALEVVTKLVPSAEADSGCSTSHFSGTSVPGFHIPPAARLEPGLSHLCVRHAQFRNRFLGAFCGSPITSFTSGFDGNSVSGVQWEGPEALSAVGQRRGRWNVNAKKGDDPVKDGHSHSLAGHSIRAALAGLSGPSRRREPGSATPCSPTGVPGY